MPAPLPISVHLGKSMPFGDRLSVPSPEALSFSSLEHLWSLVSLCWWALGGVVQELVGRPTLCWDHTHLIYATTPQSKNWSRASEGRTGEAQIAHGPEEEQHQDLSPIFLRPRTEMSPLRSAVF